MIKKRSTIFFILAFIIMSLSIFSSSAFMISNLERSVNGGYISETVSEDAELAGFPSQLDLT